MLMMFKKGICAGLITALLIGSALGAGPTTQAVNSPASSLSNLTAYGVQINAITDAGTIAIPSYVTAYQVTAFKITNCSGIPVLAQVGLYTGSGATGTPVVTPTTITGATSSTVVLSQTVASSARLTATTLFIRVSVANAASVTCDMKIAIDDLS